jgi:hypothetical protein
MAVGFSSPLFLLGLSRSAVEVTVGRGAGPLPIHMGAIGIYSPPIITPDKPYVVQGGGWLPRGWVDRRRSSDTSQSVIQDDNEIMELLANILPIIIG